jgi:O-antigen/teichoic acid export membrane protein
MINSRRIFSNAALSVLQTGISAILLFFLYRYLLVRLGPEQLGVWSVVLASTSVARLSDMGFSGAVVRFVARHLSKQLCYQLV